MEVGGALSAWLDPRGESIDAEAVPTAGRHRQRDQKCESNAHCRSVSGAPKGINWGAPYPSLSTHIWRFAGAKLIEQ